MHVQSPGTLNAGADIEAKDVIERTPLHLATGYNENPDITKALIDAGANLETRDNDWGFTPLHRAAAWNKYLSTTGKEGEFYKEALALLFD